jgi:hypothetical protein
MSSFVNDFLNSMLSDPSAPFESKSLEDFLIESLSPQPGQPQRTLVDFLLASELEAEARQANIVVKRRYVQALGQKRVRRHLPHWSESNYYLKYVASDNFLDPHCPPASAVEFRQRFRMPLSTFRQLVADARAGDWFPGVGTRDAAGKFGPPLELLLGATTPTMPSRILATPGERCIASFSPGSCPSAAASCFHFGFPRQRTRPSGAPRPRTPWRVWTAVLRLVMQHMCSLSRPQPV